eukprot:6084882-Amphidinium_carterae.1
MSVLGYFYLLLGRSCIGSSFCVHDCAGHAQRQSAFAFPLRPKNCSTKGIVAKHLWNSASTQFAREW